MVFNSEFKGLTPRAPITFGINLKKKKVKISQRGQSSKIKQLLNPRTMFVSMGQWTVQVSVAGMHQVNVMK